MRTLWRSTIGLLFALGLALSAGHAEDTHAGQAFASLLAGDAAEGPAAGNRVLSVGIGYDALLLRVHLIRQARRSIEIQTFIWSNDEVGRLMIYELVEAAKRGVKVRVIADHMVSDQDPAIGAFLATVHPNLEVRHYRPAMARLKPSFMQKLLAGAFSFHGTNQRMHNKVMIVDGAALITGGRNIENTYYDHATGLNFRDRDVFVVGPVALEAEASFEKYWHYRHTVPSAELQDVAAVLARGDYRRYESRADYDFGGYFSALDWEADDGELMQRRFWSQMHSVRRVEFIADEPGKGRSFFTKNSKVTVALRQQLDQAEREIVIQSPYLILSRTARGMVRDLRKAHPNLSIRISTNSYASTDNLLAYSANYRLRGDYVDKLHLQVFEFKPHPEALRTLFPNYDEIAQRATGTAKPFLCIHAKSLVVDGRLSFVGSYNLDPRSESLNTEVGLIIEDDAFAAALKTEIEHDMQAANSWVIARREFPLMLGTVNSLIDEILSISPIDVWPIQNTSSFELKPGEQEVSSDDPRFYLRYRDAGVFPGTDGLLTTKDMLTRLYKVVGAPLTPVM